jgi:hypothetical protein
MVIRQKVEAAKRADVPSAKRKLSVAIASAIIMN